MRRQFEIFWGLEPGGDGASSATQQGGRQCASPGRITSALHPSSILRAVLFSGFNGLGDAYQNARHQNSTLEE